jgi:hypothetical protein
MSSRSVSDIQTRAEGESLYIRYRSDANVLSYLKNDPSYEFIGEVILNIPNFKNFLSLHIFVQSLAEQKHVLKISEQTLNNV